MLSTIKQASHLSRPTAQGLGMRVFTIGYFASKLYNVVCMDGKWSSQSARLVSWSHAQPGFIILTADILHSFRATAKWVIPAKWHSQPICNSHSMRHTTSCNLALLPCSCHEVPATNWILFLRYHPLIGHEPWTFFEAWGASHRLSTAIGNLSFLRVLGQVAARCDSQLTFSATRNASIVLRFCRFCKIKAIDNIVKGFKYLATCQTLCNVKTSLEPASYNLQDKVRSIASRAGWKVFEKVQSVASGAYRKLQ